MEQADQNNVIKKKHKGSLWKKLLLTTIVLFLVTTTIAVALTYFLMAETLKKEYSKKLDLIVALLEKRIDNDDLAACTRTGVKSEKYVALQQYINEAVDDFGTEYIYIVIPKEDRMINVMSSTNAKEREAGEEDFELLEELVGYYSESTFKEFINYYENTLAVMVFEETSEWGSYYTACKPLFDSTGERFALLCVDIPMDDVNAAITRSVLLSVGIIVAIFFAYGLIALLFIKERITTPLRMLEESAHEFANSGFDETGRLKIRYNAPDIHGEDEVASLARTIEKMANDLKKSVDENVSNKKIRELSRTVTSLLDNMPAMTFAKDIETGKYIACNQTFAENAGKVSAKEVIGLTDYDLYDKATADHFIEYDKRALAMDTPFTYYETAKDSDGRTIKFQTTKLKFYDASGTERLLGMSLDLSELEHYRQESEEQKEAYYFAKKESVTYANIAKSLSSDYAYLFYVNLETDDYIQYSSSMNKEDLSMEERGHDFFGSSRHNALTILDKADQEVFITAFTKENVLAKIDAAGSFTITYRMVTGPSLGYHNMKATYLKGDTKHIIIGVSNINEQIREQEALKRVSDEKTTYARLTALTGDFLCIYTVNPKTCHYFEYTVTKEYQDFGLAKSGDDFFAQARFDAKTHVYSLDVDRFCNAVTLENVLAEIKDHGLFEIDYRTILAGEPIYTTLRGALVHEKDGDQIVFGIINVDARVKRDRDMLRSLSSAKKKADMDALTGIKNKHAYIDSETRLNRRIEDDEEVKFALVVCDVNGLKEVNDKQGHVAGDEHIKTACAMICDVFKHSPVFRIGGDEFVSIVQGRDYEAIDALLAQMDEANMKHKQEGKATAACGMSKYQKGDRSVSIVFKRADAMMYYNKRKMKGEI